MACEHGTSILLHGAAVAHKLATLTHIISLLVSFACVITSMYVQSH